MRIMDVVTALHAKAAESEQNIDLRGDSLLGAFNTGKTVAYNECLRLISDFPLMLSDIPSEIASDSGDGYDWRQIFPPRGDAVAK